MSSGSTAFFGCIGVAVSAVILIAALSLIGAIPTYYLWNWLMPAIFGIKLITFWQALGINLFTRILFHSHSATSSKKE